MVTGFIKLNGATVGVVANRTARFEDGAVAEEFDNVLTTGGSYKAAEFVNFCDAFEIPDSDAAYVSRLFDFPEIADGNFHDASAIGRNDII